MKDLSTHQGYRPAKGLKKLTWAQLEQIDETIDLMCALSRRDKSEIRITLLIKNGQPRFIEHPVVSQELKPVR